MQQRCEYRASGVSRRRDRTVERARVRVVIFIALLTAGLLMGGSTSASTLKLLTPAQMTEQAVTIVRGRVIGIETIATGTRLEQTAEDPYDTQAPVDDDRQVEGNPVLGEEFELVDPLENLAQLEPPSDAGTFTKGGRMLHTRVMFELLETVKGQPAQVMEFTVAGGQLGDERVVVFGLPTFELGDEYVLFLRYQLEAVTVPVVGGDQGFFKVDRSSGRAELRDAHGARITGLDGHEVHRERDSRSFSHYVAGPIPEGSNTPVPARFVGSVASQAQALESQRPMALADFLESVRRLERQAVSMNEVGREEVQQ